MYLKRKYGLHSVNLNPQNVDLMVLILTSNGSFWINNNNGDRNIKLNMCKLNERGITMSE